MTKEKINVQQKGKIIGAINRNGIFVPIMTVEHKGSEIVLLRRVEERHLFRKYNAYSLHEPVFNFLKSKFNLNTKLIHIERNTNKKYISTLSDWENEGEWKVNEGEATKTGFSGTQIILKRNKMTTPSEMKKSQEVDWEKMRQDDIRKRDEGETEKRSQFSLFTSHTSRATLPNEETFIASTISEMTTFSVPNAIQETDDYWERIRDVERRVEEVEKNTEKRIRDLENKWEAVIVDVENQVKTNTK